MRLKAPEETLQPVVWDRAQLGLVADPGSGIKATVSIGLAAGG